MNHQLLNNNQGAAALITVIAVMAILFSLITVVSKFSLNGLAINLESDQSHKALQIAEACAEESALRLKLDSSYTGGSLTFAVGSCTISISGAGTTRTATVVATVGQNTRDVQVNLTLVSNISATAEGLNFSNWEEKN